MLGRMAEFTARRETFAIKTTLAGRGHAQRIRRRQQTPAILAGRVIEQESEPTPFFRRLESAALAATRTIGVSASRIPTPILVWDDGETVLINSITEQRIRDHGSDDSIDPI